MKRPPGRPTKLTPETQQVIVEALERGHYAEVAARLGGIDEKTYYVWIKHGTAGREPYAAFVEAVDIAGAKAEDDALKRVHAGSRGDDGTAVWSSAMTFLERRFHARWGRRDALYDEQRKQMATELAKSKLEIDTLKAKLKLLEAGQDPDAARVELIVHHDAIEE